MGFNLVNQTMEVMTMSIINQFRSKSLVVAFASLAMLVSPALHAASASITPYVRENGQLWFLLCKNKGTQGGRTVLEYPGGFAERGETFGQAAIREAAEELSLVLDNPGLIPKHTTALDLRQTNTYRVLDAAFRGGFYRIINGNQAAHMPGNLAGHGHASYVVPWHAIGGGGVVGQRRRLYDNFHAMQRAIKQSKLPKHRGNGAAIMAAKHDLREKTALLWVPEQEVRHAINCGGHLDHPVANGVERYIIQGHTLGTLRTALSNPGYYLPW